MKIIKEVQSSNIDFQAIEVNNIADIVYIRYDEEKWIVDDTHIGWIYTEEQYSIREYILKTTKDNQELSTLLMETMNTSYETQANNEILLMDLYNTIGGMQDELSR